MITAADPLQIPVTAFYAALFGVMLVALSVQVVRRRGRFRVDLGDGDNAELRRAIRIHANFIEYVPMALILFGAAEVNEAPRWLLHGLGQVLLLGRMAHVYALTAANLPVRVAAMAATWTTILVLALWLLGRLAGLW